MKKKKKGFFYRFERNETVKPNSIRIAAVKWKRIRITIKAIENIISVVLLSSILDRKSFNCGIFQFILWIFIY